MGERRVQTPQLPTAAAATSTAAASPAAATASSSAPVPPTPTPSLRPAPREVKVGQLEVRLPRAVAHRRRGGGEEGRGEGAVVVPKRELELPGAWGRPRGGGHAGVKWRSRVAATRCGDVVVTRGGYVAVTRGGHKAVPRGGVARLARAGWPL